MNSKDIRFTKEISFTLRIDNSSKFKQGEITDYQLAGKDVLLFDGDNYVAGEVILAAEDVANQLSEYKDRSLLRVDHIDQIKGTIFCTLLVFFKHERENEPFTIVIDQAIHSELRKRDIDINRASKWIKEQIVLNDRYVFAFGSNNTEGELTLIGKNVYVVIAMAAQGYLHVIDIRDNKRNTPDNLVMLISGEVQIEDRITNTSILSQELQKKYKDLTRDNAELIKLWRIYDALDLEAIKEDAEDMGYLKYNSYRHSGDSIVFSLDREIVRRDFVRDNMFYVALDEVFFHEEAPLDYDPRLAVILGTEVDPQCVHSAEFRIIEDTTDDFKRIPKKGYILPSTSGSEVQSRRRNIARSKILNGRSELVGLNVLIQAGDVVGIQGKTRPGISAHLEDYIFEGDKSKHFNENQKKAISIALNTPDIAIIQGPPGTGKTDVIRAIVERINELENGKARILISSTQHDAVDNAVKNVSYGGVPVNRVARRVKNVTSDTAIYQWIDTVIASCDNWLQENIGTSESEYQKLYQDIEAIREYNDATLPETLNSMYATLQEMNFPVEILTECTGIIADCISKSTNDNESMLGTLLSQQKTNPADFLNDGKEALHALERYLKYDSDDVDFEIPDYWKELRHLNEPSEELNGLLMRFEEDLKKLGANTASTAIDNSIDNQKIDSLIDQILNEISLRGNTSQDLELYDLIWGLKHELTCAENVKKLVSDCSKVNAATCQQSANRNLSPAMHGFMDSYDYVIIDEAARSNPLDLMIPMSMGKKIILVGDHKQLPHMVDEKIISKVVAKTADVSSDDILRESLFQRMFNKIKDVDSKNGTDRTCTLNEQFRMHPDICDLIKVFYKEENITSGCTKEQKKHSLGLYKDKALAWIDVPISEKTPAETPGISKSRACEIEIIVSELRKILDKNQQYSIGVITFYSKQAADIRDRLEEEFPSDIYRISVGTVDAFQGKEFDVVLLSTVRANREEESRKRVGFLDDNNRLCVAFSRAKRMLVAVGDAKTVAQDGDNIIIGALYEMYNRCKAGEVGYYESKTI